MNCTLCGNPLLFDRVAFNCSCGAFVHAYCWDEHVLQAHRPAFEIGNVNLDGEFVPRESKVEVAVSDEQFLDTSISGISTTEEEALEVVATEEKVSESSLPEPEDSEQQASEEQTAEEGASEE
jgi:hypothetical protein